MELLSNSTSYKLFCYFCLRCNSIKHLNSQGETDVTGNEKEEVVSSLHEFSLRNLYRFLDLLHSDKEERDFKNIKMMVCDDCLKLNDEFNNLYNLLEETKLRLNWSVKKIEDVMAKAGKIAEDNEDTILQIWRTHTLDRMQKFTRTSFPLVILHKNERIRQYPWIEEVERARTRMTVEKEQGMPGKLKAETMVGEEFNLYNDEESTFFTDDRVIPKGDPYIQMECDAEVAKLCPQSPFLSSEDALPTLPKNSKVEANSNVERQRRGRPPILSKFSPVPNEKTKVCCKSCLKIVDRSKAFAHLKHDCSNGYGKPSISTNKKKHSRKCAYCSYITLSPAGSLSSVNSMVAHVVRFHPEHYLISEKEKAEGLWHQEFQTILCYMIYPSFIGNEDKCQRFCASCGKTFNINKSDINFNKHLIFHHKLELKEKFKAILEDPTSEERIKIYSSIPSIHSSRVTEQTNLSSDCPYCNYKTVSPAGTPSSKRAIRLHMVHFHPEHYLIDEIDKASGLWHEQFQSILTNFVYPNFMLKKGNQRSCICCGKLFKFKYASMNAKYLRSHLIFRHKHALKKKIRAVLEDPSLEENLKSCNSSIAIVSNRNPRVPLQCRYCNYKAVSHTCSSSALSSMMDLHLVRLHPEHYLVNKNDKALGLWHAQFQKILRNMIYPSFMSNEGHQRCCTLCEKRYQFKSASQNAVMLKKHLMLHHELELKTKLKLILEDPLLDEKLGASHGKIKYSLKCSYCRFECTNASNPRNSMDRHYVRFHPEHFFIENEDIPTSGHPQFQRILWEIVFPNFVLLTGHHTKCSLCKMKYTTADSKSKNIANARKHIIRRHMAELKKSINYVLEDPMLEDKLVGSSANGVTCSCGVYLEGHSNSLSSYHKIFHCIKIQGPNKL